MICCIPFDSIGTNDKFMNFFIDSDVRSSLTETRENKQQMTCWSLIPGIEIHRIKRKFYMNILIFKSIHRQILQIQDNTTTWCYENDQSVCHVPGDSKLCGNSLLIRSFNEKRSFQYTWEREGERGNQREEVTWDYWILISKKEQNLQYFII